MSIDISPPVPLQERSWPPVPGFTEIPTEIQGILKMPKDERKKHIIELRSTPDEHSRILHQGLSLISSYLFGYADSPLHGAWDEDLELRFQDLKLTLERELLDYWLPTAEVPPEIATQQEAAAHLEHLARSNPSLSHPLFPYLRSQATRTSLFLFLRNEVARNEVVDDEVAMMSVGLQGDMKRTVVANLWDECGRGDLQDFHTYWLRRLVERHADWDSLIEYRLIRPWFTQITTNVFNAFLTRPGLRLRAYGWFAVNESWVAPHFEDILVGTARTGLDDEETEVYFRKHVVIDPYHTAELTRALRQQVPALSRAEAREVVRGAHNAIAATGRQYDAMLKYLAEQDRRAGTAESLPR